MTEQFRYNAFSDYSSFNPAEELKKIHMIDDQFVKQSFSVNLKHFFDHLFPNCQSKQSLIEAQANILIVDTVPLDQLWQNTLTELPAEQFYAAICQILDFNAGLDFELTASRDFLTKSGQKILSDETVDTANLVQFMFNALNLRSANGLSLIDNLVNDGYLRKAWPQDLPLPLFFAGKTLAVVPKSDLISEAVYVDSQLDGDHDGKNDLIQLVLTRPKQSGPDLKVPVILTASPYYYGTNDMAEDVHNPDGDLAVKDNFDFADQPIADDQVLLPALTADQQSQSAAFQQTLKSGAASFPLNDYFLARGYAVAYYAGPGTRRSDGLRSSGGPDETIACCAAIEYLSGHRLAFTDKTASHSLHADWSNGSVAMTGRSYLGTLATACATRNPAGLKTIISESAISSWYDYYRENGLVVAPGGFQGEDADVLALDTFSRWFDAAEMAKSKQIFQDSLAEMKVEEDRTTGNYTAFWDKRNYLKDAGNIKIDCLYTHGLNDWNVKPINVFNILKSLKGTGDAAAKVILHQGRHISPHDIRSLDYLDICNLWLSHELYGQDNQVEKSLPDVMVEDNLDPEIWHSQQDWAKSERHQSTVLAALSSAKTAGYDDDLGQIYRENYHDYTSYEKDFYAGDARFAKSTAVFDLPSFGEATINGRVQVDLRIQTDRTVGLVTAALVELDAKEHASQTTKAILNRGFQLSLGDRQVPLRDFFKQSVKAHLIANGHLNLQNLKGPGKINQLKPDQYVQAVFYLQPTIYRLTDQTKLRLYIFGSDMQYTLHPRTVQHYQLDLEKSRVILPLNS
ncbi:MAG: Xaa-Pro dipeptidyl-peptidase [Oenococcus sp.]|uniref:Xaa-Pro dipeptidyl-peptidase n=1 Tax=Oenococcus sp. TaxID=1979414 RepID=UPI0039E84495